jgi:hypothetical protein
VKQVDGLLLRLQLLLALVLLPFQVLPAGDTVPQNAASRDQPALTGSDRLREVYDSILAAQFDRVEYQLRRACPPAPDPSCRVLEAVSTQWQILIDPESYKRDQPLNDAAAAAIAACELWTRREALRAEAWFYLAGSYAPLVQWHVLRGQRVAAAREGARIKAALERALQLDPSLSDAHFGIGLYHYYAAVAPASARILRFLLFLPGGDRELGLREMLEARERGKLLRGEADYQLQIIDVRYENKPLEALEILESLDARYPSNPIFLQHIAGIRDTRLHDARASAVAWRVLLERADGGSVYEPQITATRARLGLAAALVEMNEVDAAIAELQIVIKADPIEPNGARGHAEALMRSARLRKNF